MIIRSGCGPASPAGYSGSPASSSSLGTSAPGGSSNYGAWRDAVRPAASECAPQPYSTLITRPSAGESPFVHTPKAARSDPATGTQNAQVPQCAGALRAIALRGPTSPAHHRSAASARPSRDSTRSRPRPSSKATAAACSASAESSVEKNATTTRGSSGSAGKRSPGLRSPGRSRSLHGTHAGASSASGPGSSTTSSTVTDLERGARVTATDQNQPA